MKALFITLCAAAMVVAQPAFADQSDDIRGTWDCVVSGPDLSSETVMHFQEDGTLVSVSQTLLQFDAFMTMEFDGTFVGVWQIENGTLTVKIDTVEFSRLIMNGNDHLHGPIEGAVASSVTSLDPALATLEHLDSELLKMSNTDGAVTECARYLGS